MDISLQPSKLAPTMRPIRQGKSKADTWEIHPLARWYFNTPIHSERYKRMIMEASSVTLLFEENPKLSWRCRSFECTYLLQDIVVLLILLFGGELGGVCFDKQFPLLPSGQFSHDFQHEISLINRPPAKDDQKAHSRTNGDRLEALASYKGACKLVDNMLKSENVEIMHKNKFHWNILKGTTPTKK